MRKSPRHKKSSCALEKREELIHAYLMHRLPEDQTDDLEAHILECEQCFRELKFQDDLRSVAGQMRDEVALTPRPIPFYKSIIPAGRAWIIAAAAIMLLAIGLYGGVRAMRPPLYESATLTSSEKDGLQTASRGDTLIAQEEFAAGAQALLAAPQKRFFVLPYFDQTPVNQAIGHFRAAYESSRTASEQNECAYFLGKAYLMRADADSSCMWLKRVTGSGAALYQDEARSLLRQLGCKGRP